MKIVLLIFFKFSIIAKCTCKYSSGICPIHGSSHKSHGYVLPVRYETASYDNPRSRRSSGFLGRFSRESPWDKHIDHWVSTTSTAAKNIKEHFGKLGSAAPKIDFKEHIDTFASKFHPIIKERFAKYAEVFNVASVRDKFSKIADKYRVLATNTDNQNNQQANSDNQRSDSNTFNRFSQNFDQQVDSNRENDNNRQSDASIRSSNSDDRQNNNDAQFRKRRSIDEPAQQNDNRKYPILKVKESSIPCETIKNLRELSKTRVELQSPETLQYMPELASNIYETEKCPHCHNCGSQLSDSICRSCGEKQPQYIEYVNGKAVSYQPGPEQETYEKAPTEKRYIFDRYGQKYLENKGNLRLVAPQPQQQQREEVVGGSRPDYDGLAYIFRRNKEVMDDLNGLQDPTRIVPRPLELIRDGLEYIHDLSRRNADYRNMKMKDSKFENKMSGEKDEKTVSENESQKSTANKLPSSMYQIVPMNVNGHDGKLFVKVYSAKNAAKKSAETDLENKTKVEEKQTTAEVSGDKDKMKPVIKKLCKDDKEFQVVTFDESPANSAEEIDQILKNLYGDSTAIEYEKNEKTE